MKICNTCKIEKDFSEFHKGKCSPGNPDGYQYKCKACVKTYYQANRERHIEINKGYYKDNKEKKLEYTKKYIKSKEDGYCYVYLLPKENYVGCTNNVYMRMCNHRSVNRDTSGYIVLGRFKDRDEALRLETSYHDKGYAGKHAFNCYK
jgi:hypothetical protein